MMLTIEQTVVACITLHLIADYTLQGCLADLKQKAWWNRQIENKSRETLEKHVSAVEIRSQLQRKYGEDYKAALLGHSIMWAALTFLPLCTATGWSLIVAVNAWIHYLIDDLKANHLKINLVTDQALHGWQIGLTLGGYFFVKFIIGG